MYKGTLFFLATDTSLYLLCHKRCNWQFFLQFLCNADSYILLITKWFSLQTLTAEIGNVLELKDVDKGIDDYRSTPHLTFDQYRYYLSKEVNISFFIPFSSNFLFHGQKIKLNIIGGFSSFWRFFRHFRRKCLFQINMLRRQS